LRYFEVSDELNGPNVGFPSELSVSYISEMPSPEELGVENDPNRLPFIFGWSGKCEE